MLFKFIQALIKAMDVTSERIDTAYVLGMAQLSDYPSDGNNT